MASGSQIIISKDGITVITPGKFEAHAAEHLFLEGASVHIKPPLLMRTYQTQYHLSDEKTGLALPNHAYQIVLANGRKIIGTTDSSGLTKTVYTAQAEDTDVTTAQQPEHPVEAWYFAGDDQQDPIYADLLDVDQADQ